MSRWGRRSDASLAGTAWVAAAPSPERCRSQPRAIYQAFSNLTSKPIPTGNTASVLLWRAGDLGPAGIFGLRGRLLRWKTRRLVRTAHSRRAAGTVRSARRLSATPMDRGPSATDEDQPVLQNARRFGYRALAVQ